MRDLNPFMLTREPVDAAANSGLLIDKRAGAQVTFEGRVRNHNDGRDVLSLEYEAYDELAAKEGARIIQEALRRFDIISARCLHRLGKLEIGEIAVWVGVTSEHRADAFDACRFIIDEVKARVPIWKRETYADGSSEWVNCGHHERGEKVSRHPECGNHEQG